MKFVTVLQFIFVEVLVRSNCEWTKSLLFVTNIFSSFQYLICSWKVNFTKFLLSFKSRLHESRKHFGESRRLSRDHSTAWKIRKFALTVFWQKFVKALFLLKELLKELISPNFFQWEICTAVEKRKIFFCTFWQKFRESNVFTKEVTK